MDDSFYWSDACPVCNGIMMYGMRYCGDLCHRNDIGEEAWARLEKHRKEEEDRQMKQNLLKEEGKKKAESTKKEIIENMSTIKLYQVEEFLNTGKINIPDVEFFPEDPAAKFTYSLSIYCSNVGFGEESRMLSYDNFGGKGTSELSEFYQFFVSTQDIIAWSRDTSKLVKFLKDNGIDVI